MTWWMFLIIMPVGGMFLLVLGLLISMLVEDWKKAGHQ